jgi:hypothetical protein
MIPANVSVRTSGSFGMLQVTVHCEHCGRANPCVESKAPGETIHLICHHCETPLRARWPEADRDDPAFD